MGYYGVDLNPCIEQYVVILQAADGHKERASGLYKVKKNALAEASRRNDGVKADRERFKDVDSAWVKELCKRHFYVAKISYEEVTD